MEAAFLRRLAKQLGVGELSEEALAKSLGIDVFTDDKLDDWFVAMVHRYARGIDEPEPQPKPAEKVVQTDRARPQVIDRPALPPGPKRRNRAR